MMAVTSVHSPVSCISTTRHRVAESPVWDGARNHLWWCDIFGRTLNRLDMASGEISVWGAPSEIGAVGLCLSGRLIVALRHEICFFDPASGAFQTFVRLNEPDLRQRFNDGKVGPDGAFWIGAMDDRPVKEPIASLWRVGPDGALTAILDGLVVSNGLAWSPDGRHMWHSDSRGQWIDRYRFDSKTGRLLDKEWRILVSAETGRPDGAAADMEGFYWSCGVSAGAINRFNASGQLVERRAVPVPAPTMPCFGGPGMTTLFFTSMSEWQDPGTVRAHPLTGGVFALEAGVQGVPVGLFDDRAFQ